MTKSQSNQAFSTASGQNAQENTNAQSSYNAAQTDIGNYENQLSQYSAANPFVQGGQYQTSQNQGLADTAAAGSQSAAQAIESSGVRSGQNPAAGIAAAEQVSEANNRNQSADVDEANQSRMQGLTQYGNTVLNASAKPAEMETSLNQAENSAADSTLGDETNASKTPSVWQTLGQATAGAAGSALGKAIGCWIAARLYGGWGDDRVTLMRLWLGWSFSKTWRGQLLVSLYAKYGQRMAEDWMPRSTTLTRVMEWVFAHGLGHAERWLATADGHRMWGRYEAIKATPDFFIFADNAQDKSDAIIGTLLEADNRAENFSAFFDRMEVR